MTSVARRLWSLSRLLTKSIIRRWQHKHFIFSNIEKGRRHYRHLKHPKPVSVRKLAHNIWKKDRKTKKYIKKIVKTFKNVFFSSLWRAGAESNFIHQCDRRRGGEKKNVCMLHNTRYFPAGIDFICILRYSDHALFWEVECKRLTLRVREKEKRGGKKRSPPPCGASPPTLLPDSADGIREAAALWRSLKCTHTNVFASDVHLNKRRQSSGRLQRKLTSVEESLRWVKAKNTHTFFLSLSLLLPTEPVMTRHFKSPLICICFVFFVFFFEQC